MTHDEIQALSGRELDERITAIRHPRNMNHGPLLFSERDGLAAELRREMYDAGCDIDIEVIDDGIRMTVYAKRAPERWKILQAHATTEAVATARVYLMFMGMR